MAMIAIIVVITMIAIIAIITTIAIMAIIARACYGQSAYCFLDFTGLMQAES